MQTNWAILESMDSQRCKDIQLKNNRILIGRDKKCDIVIKDKKLSSVHSEINKYVDQIFIIDRSQNGTFVNDQRIKKNERTEIKNNDKISLIHQSMVKPQQVIEFKLVMNQNYKKDQTDDQNENMNDVINSKRDKERKEEEQIIDKKKQQIQGIGDEMTCGICLDYIYKCYTVLDCLHNFCSGCLSSWLKKSKECPHCREKILVVKKNALVNNIVEKYLDINPSNKRSQQEYDDLDKQNTLLQDKVEVQKQKKERKQNNSRRRLNNQGCRECTQSRQQDGFQCQVGQTHLVCQACTIQFPDRGVTFNQKCIICQAPNCNIYYGMCNSFMNQLKLLRDIDKPLFINQNIFNNNKQEQRILVDYLISNNMDGSDVYNYVKTNFISTNQFVY